MKINYKLTTITDNTLNHVSLYLSLLPSHHFVSVCVYCVVAAFCPPGNWEIATHAYNYLISCSTSTLLSHLLNARLLYLDSYSFSVVFFLVHHSNIYFLFLDC